MKKGFRTRLLILVALSTALILSFSGCTHKNPAPSAPISPAPSASAVVTASPTPTPTVTPSESASPSPSDVVVTPEIPISELYKADTIKSKDGAVLVEYDAALPLVSGGSAKAITTINEYYKQEMQAFLTNAETELKTTAQLNYDNSKQSGNSFIPCNAHENYTVEYSKNGVLSIAREINFFFGSVNVDANVKSDTFDMQTGDRIVLDNIFSVGEDTYLPRLSGAVSAQIKKLGAMNAGYYDDYEQRAKDYLLKEDFYLTEKGVVVYYPTITVAPEMLGVCRFEIPYADLNDILAERFK